jgi:hypothetical protein
MVWACAQDGFDLLFCVFLRHAIGVSDLALARAFGALHRRVSTYDARDLRPLALSQERTLGVFLLEVRILATVYGF